MIQTTIKFLEENYHKSSIRKDITSSAGNKVLTFHSHSLIQENNTYRIQETLKQALQQQG
jgi:hypothetical protein